MASDLVFRSSPSFQQRKQLWEAVSARAHTRTVPLPPVVGAKSNFEVEKKYWNEMREAIENIVRSLRFLEFEDEQHDHRSVVFKGMTAEAFKETAKDIKKSLTDLQSISSAVVGVFDKFEVKHKIL